jgi:hypothetical protein
LKTGKDQVETVTAVLVHHDTDLYGLKVRTGRTTSVIDTTSNQVDSLKYGTHLYTSSASNNAVVIGG